MKKIICLCLLLCPIFVMAATPDKTPPTLNSIEFNNTEFKVGSEICIKVNAVDDISGVDSIQATFYDKEDNNNLFVVFFILRNSTGPNYNVCAPIDSYVTEGKYLLKHFSVVDIARNPLNFIQKDFKKYFKTVDFEIRGYEEGISQPAKLISASVDKKVILKGEQTKITVELEPPKQQKIDKISVYYDGEKPFQVELTHEKDNIWTGIFDSENKTGKYEYYNSNIKYEINGVVREVDRTVVNFSKKNTMTFTFLNDNDNIAPKILNIEVDKTEIIPPEIVKVIVTFEDKSNIKSGNIMFFGDKNTPIFGYAKQNSDGFINNGNKIEFYADFSQLMPTGKYHLRDVIIVDEYSNSNDLDISNADSNSLNNESVFDKDFYVTVLEEKNVDVVTSTQSQEIINKIKVAKNDAIININAKQNDLISADVFEAIVNTNKTISIENNGVYWIFNGSDITNPKDVKTTVNFEFLNNNENDSLKDIFTNALIIKFFENGQLPGKAKIRIKASYAFKSYLGIEDLSLYFVDKTDELDKISEGISITNDGYYEFYVNHNSTYVLTKNIVDENKLRTDDSIVLGNDKLNEENDFAKTLTSEAKNELLSNPEDKIEVTDDVKEIEKIDKSSTKDMTILKIGIGCLVVLIAALGILLVIKRKK